MDEPTRSATLTRSKPLSIDRENMGLYVSDKGFQCYTVEKPWKEDRTDVSCIAPGRYRVTWRWSDKHQCNLYHVEDPSRPGAEIHGANVQEQLEGCVGPGAAVAPFAKDSIAPGIPSIDCQGVTESRETLALLEKDMRDPDGNQVSFWLTIQ